MHHLQLCPCGPQIMPSFLRACVFCCAPTHQPVEVLWIFNHQWAAWEAALPQETRKRLEEDREGNGIHHMGVMKREVLDGELLQGPHGVS